MHKQIYMYTHTDTHPQTPFSRSYSYTSSIPLFLQLSLSSLSFFPIVFDSALFVSCFYTPANTSLSRSLPLWFSLSPFLPPSLSHPTSLSSSHPLSLFLSISDRKSTR